MAETTRKNDSLLPTNKQSTLAMLSKTVRHYYIRWRLWYLQSALGQVCCWCCSHKSLRPATLAVQHTSCPTKYVNLGGAYTEQRKEIRTHSRGTAHIQLVLFCHWHVTVIVKDEGLMRVKNTLLTAVRCVTLLKLAINRQNICPLTNMLLSQTVTIAKGSAQQTQAPETLRRNW